jgi:hypothetical protein
VEAASLKLAALTRPFPGETHNGDAYFLAAVGRDGASLRAAASDPTVATGREPETVHFGEEDKVLLAVVDGVGHGPDAAAVTTRILACLRANLRLEPAPLLQECHRAVEHSRGAAVGIALLDPAASQVRFVGVGNIKMQLLSRDLTQVAISIPDCPPSGVKIQTFVANSGIVGYRLPTRLLEDSCNHAAGDLVGMWSDGMASGFDLWNVPDVGDLTPEKIVESAFDSFRRGGDDATLVVAR